MLDPGSELRRLALRAGRRSNVGDDSSPHLIVVSGGKTRVGTTMVAVNLAASLAAQGQRTVLIDADLTHAGAASVCGCEPSPGIADVLTGRQDIHEVMQLATAGFQLVAGSRTTESQAACNERAVQRLMRQVQGLGRFADTVVVDAGEGASSLTASFWKVAQTVLLVTSTDAAAVMDSYATIKMLWDTEPTESSPRLQLVVNRTDSDLVTADVHRRIDQSCRRFLNLTVALAGGLNTHHALRAVNQLPPVVLGEPDSPLARALEAIAIGLSSENEDPRAGQAA
jgi:flagellar biosynthesis protein FlhG